jgi:hypothetical protein
MSTNFISEKTLGELPLRFRLVEKVELKDSNKYIVGRFIKNHFYNASGFICISNYRKTSKLIQVK